jgi:hypothetical protein
MADKTRSAELANQLFKDDLSAVVETHKLTPEVKADIEKATDKATNEAVRQMAYVDDKYFFRLVLVVLGLAVLIPIVGGLILIFNKVETPAFVSTIATTAVGAIAGILGPSPISKS